MNEDEKELGEIPISAENLGKLAHLVDTNVISSSIAKKGFCNHVGTR